MTSETLAHWDAEYDPEWKLAGETAKTPGYHTRVADGARVHSTRANLDYALALLEAGPGRYARAAEVIDTVLALQETDPTDPTYGIWPWFADEPLPQMAPPDWNWADFCGARLAEILRFHAGALDEGLASRIRAALGHAGWSIFRRNMNPGYTNIALMGAAVTSAAGELLDEPRLLAYGHARFARFVEYTERQGSFNEYNSPAYTPLAIEECERALRLCRDPGVRRQAEAMRRKGWEIAADHFHAPTFSWGGPHSRAYADRLTPAQAHWLRQRLDAPAGDPVACPDELRPAFAQLPQPTWARHVYQRDADSRPRLTGSVWRGPAACLGSIDHDTLWVQRRAALGYWKSGDAVAVFRIRFLKDAADFASADYFGVQEKNRLLSAVGFRLDQGDFHCGLDRPAKPVFAGSLWRVRFQLDAPDAVAEPAAYGFRLSAGGHRVDVLPAKDCLFDGKPVVWRCGKDTDGVAWVDAVVYEGPAKAIDLAALGQTRLAAACQVVERDAPPPAETVVATEASCRWDGMELPWGKA